MKHFFRLVLTSTVVAILAVPSYSDERPSLFLGQAEAKAIRAALAHYPLLQYSFQKTKAQIDETLLREIEVPPPGEAGSYEHEKHKQNYRDMRQAGLLFRITGEEKYANFAREMLVSYAKMYPKLGPHPLSHKQMPGKLFHQTLNEAVWLVYVSQAYDCIYDWLSEADRKSFEKNIFRPMIQWLSERNEKEFNRIHNHGTWAVAAVGMIGYVLKDEELVAKALYGTRKDGEGGFLKQLDLLFSPDGYYMEGPYYIRYALRPFFLFAEAVERNQPELRIFDYRDQILKKAFYSAAQTIFPNGIFPPINDASRTMDIRAPGPQIAHNLAYLRYGRDDNLLAIAGIQDNVILNGAGLAVAKDYSELDSKPELNWGSVEFTDGHDGEQGGLGILRMGKGLNQSMLLMKYGVHGEGHGHFDKLHFMFFDQGREVIPDYGFSRWINIEPKFGGRYLPENNSYAKQTIAHNTVVVDQTTQNGFKRSAAEEVSGKRHFFDSSQEAIKVVSAKANDYYPGVEMQRTLFLIKDDRLAYPVVVDLYRLSSSTQHQYDYPVHYRGQIISSTLKIQARAAQQTPVGTDFGYQHIWEEGRGETVGPMTFTWLDGNRYYTLVSSVDDNTPVILGRTGANDPNFNLISEPMVIIRTQGSDYLFASVFEPHGYFNEAMEKSDNARGLITSVKVLGHDETASAVEVAGKDGLKWRILVNNGHAEKDRSFSVSFAGRDYQWRGNYDVLME